MKTQGRFSVVVALLAIAVVVSGCASKSPAPVVERGGQSATAPVPAASGKDFYTVRKGDTLYSIALDHGLDYKELAAANNIDNPSRIQVGQQLRVRTATVLTGGEVAVAKPIATASAVERRSLDLAPVAAVASTNSDTLKREPKAGKESYSEQALAQAQNQPAVKPTDPASVVAVRPESASDLRQDTKAVETKTAEVAASTDEIHWIWPASGKLIGTFSESGSKGIDIAGKAGDPVLAAADGKVVYSGTGLRGYGKLVIIKHNNTYLSAYAHNQSVLVKEGQQVSKAQRIAEMGNSDADSVKLHFEVRQQGKPVDPMKHLPGR